LCSPKHERDRGATIKTAVVALRSRLTSDEERDIKRAHPREERG
jgi:hypothetical protein